MKNLAARNRRHPPLGILVAILILALASAACSHSLRRTAEGFEISGADYSIKALPGGALMPPGWTLVGYEEHEGKFSRTARRDGHDLVLQRGDGNLKVTLASGQRDCEWESDPQVCIEREYADPDLGLSGAAMLGAHGNRIVVVSARPRNFFGGFGMEVASDVVAVESGTVLAREYRFWFHKNSSSRSVVLVYSAPPRVFPGGAQDVANLVARISFR